LGSHDFGASALPGTEEKARQSDRRQSGAEIGAENVQRLRVYLEMIAVAGRGLPAHNGKVNTSAVALACGFDRAVLYQNPAARQLLEEAATRLGLDAQVSTREAVSIDLRDQRILKLEQENATLKAEIFDLRRNLRKLEHVEEIMVDTGRRITR
jgi:hypothetical protein